MARAKLYLRPVGLLYGPAAAEAMAHGLALPLAGGPDRLHRRRADRGTSPTRANRRLAPGRGARALRATPSSRPCSRRVTAERPPFAGLTPRRSRCIMGIVNVTPGLVLRRRPLRHDGRRHHARGRARRRGRRHRRCRRGVRPVPAPMPSPRPRSSRACMPVLEGLCRHARGDLDRYAQSARGARQPPSEARPSSTTSRRSRYDRREPRRRGRDRAVGHPDACQGRAQDHAGRSPL